MVISGYGWDRFIPDRFHANPPFRVVYLLQSFARLDPSDSQFEHLFHPAVRIAVSDSLAQALRALDAPVNGPIHTIPAGIDLTELKSGTRDIDALVVGMKQPGFARAFQKLAEEAGLCTTCLDAPLPRGEFLAYLARARIVVCCPEAREGFYLPALEAMALGALTICPDVEGNDYCMDRVNCLKPAYGLDAMVDGLVQAASMPQPDARAIVENARATARRHDLRYERARFQRLLRGIMETREPGA